MKKRIQIDSAILSVIIIFTGILYAFPQLYPRDLFWDHVFDFLGVICLLKGTFIRMLARGHKKAHSKDSHKLVTTGIYQLTRNPMYVGTFLIGAGFILMLWPVWGVIIFTVLFYWRFKQEVEREEKLLENNFGEQYKKYCQTTPRIFPSFDQMLKVKVKEIIIWEEALSTTERRGLLAWPALAFILELWQQKFIYGQMYFQATLTIFIWAAVIYVLKEALVYYLRK